MIHLCANSLEILSLYWNSVPFRGVRTASAVFLAGMCEVSIGIPYHFEVAPLGVCRRIVAVRISRRLLDDGALRCARNRRFCPTHAADWAAERERERESEGARESGGKGGEGEGRRRVHRMSGLHTNGPLRRLLLCPCCALTVCLNCAVGRHFGGSLIVQHIIRSRHMRSCASRRTNVGSS